MPEFSVVIPSYNHAGYIAEAVNSVLDQSLADLELIVVDDGSTDQSLAVLSGFKDPRLKIIRQDNQGAHAALNRGLQEAGGQYLALLNSDDVYHPQRLERAAGVLRTQPELGLVGSHIEIIDSGGKSLGVKHGYADCSPWPLEEPEHSFRAIDDLHAALLTENYWSTTSNFIFSRKYYDRVGDFRPLRYAHDWDFALRMAGVAPLCLLPEPLMKYRVHASNTIRENQAAMTFEILWCLAVHLPQHLSDPALLAGVSEEDRIDRLLHSIYTYDTDRALSVMLLERLHENPEKAVSLLNPNNPARAKYLDFIQDKLARSEAIPAAPQATFARRITRFLKARL